MSETQTRCHKLHGHQLNAKGQMSGKRLLCITMRTANNSSDQPLPGSKMNFMMKNFFVILVSLLHESICNVYCALTRLRVLTYT